MNDFGILGFGNRLGCWFSGFIFGNKLLKGGAVSVGIIEQLYTIEAHDPDLAARFGSVIVEGLVDQGDDNGGTLATPFGINLMGDVYISDRPDLASGRLTVTQDWDENGRPRGDSVESD